MIEKEYIYNSFPLRVVILEQRYWFVVIDIMKVLNIKCTATIVSKIDDNNKRKLRIKDKRNCPQSTWIISENSLKEYISYIAIPNIDDFKNWLDNLIFKDNRKTNDSIIESSQLNDKYLRGIRDSIISISAEIKRKLDFANAIESSSGSISIRALANILTQKNFNINQNELFEVLRQNNYLHTGGDDHNLPQKKYVDNGYFETKLEVIPLGNGTSKMYLKTLCTVKGFEHIIGEFISGGIGINHDKESQNN